MYESADATPGVRLARGMALLDEAIATICGVDPADVPAEGLGEITVTLGGHSRRITAVQAMLADRFATSGAWAADAARTPSAWLRGRSNDSEATAHGILTAGRDMRTYPVMGAAVSDGEVSLAHLRVLTKAHRRFPSLTPHLLTAEAQLVDIARGCEPKEFHSLLLDLCHRVDPCAVEHDEEQRRRDHYLHLSPLMHGEVKIDGLLPADLGSQFQALLTAARRRVEEPGTDAPPETETPPETTDQRTASQRTIDALRVILSAAAGATLDDGSIALPAVNASRPVVQLTVNLDSLLADSTNRAAAWLTAYGVPSTAVSAATAAELVCDAVIEPVVINRRGELIATLPTTRAIPPAVRKAVVLRDVHCRVPGCHRHIDEVHHVVYYSHGGTTTMANLAGLCWFHHHLIDHDHWTLTGDANDTLLLTNTATGDTWPSRPPPKQE